MQFLCHTNNLISKHFQYQTRVIMVIALNCFSNMNKVNENGNSASGNHTVTSSATHDKMVRETEWGEGALRYYFAIIRRTTESIRMNFIQWLTSCGKKRKNKRNIYLFYFRLCFIFCVLLSSSSLLALYVTFIDEYDFIII